MLSRKFYIYVVLLSILIAGPGLQQNACAETLKVPEESVDFLTKTGEALSDIAEAVKPAIVNISTTKTEKITSSPMDPFFNDPFFRRFFDERFRHPDTPRERRSFNLGSGVIVSADGYILTNSHVVKDADKIKVTLSDKREFTGKVIGNDPKTEISVIRIEAKGLPTIPVGDSDKLKVGEMVLAVGSPFGLAQTTTMGIVSALGRNIGLADYEDFIQTDAAINPGNSGGALVNARGELIGINTAIFSTSGGYQGIGFAIPSNLAKTVMKSLIEKGKVVRGWLGVSIQEVTPELAQQFKMKDDQGTLVADVVEGGPAEQAGLSRGDVIIEFDGKEINDPSQLRNMVANTPPGVKKEMKIIREGETMTMSLTIGELPAETEKVPTRYENALRGVVVQNLTPEVYRQLNLPEKMRGVIITGIEDDSPAESALLPGDVILEINRKAVSNSEDYKNIVSEIRPDKDILLLIFRKGSTIFVTIGGE
ncbi:MAG: DegQ family serine endoprotease [Nitrospirae bacterium]|nr:DegQ family serine endoprotease [Nitrospirota bacterium]